MRGESGKTGSERGALHPSPSTRRGTQRATPHAPAAPAAGGTRSCTGTLSSSSAARLYATAPHPPPAPPHKPSDDSDMPRGRRGADGRCEAIDGPRSSLGMGASAATHNKGRSAPPCPGTTATSNPTTQHTQFRADARSRRHRQARTGPRTFSHSSAPPPSPPPQTLHTPRRAYSPKSPPTRSHVASMLKLAHGQRKNSRRRSFFSYLCRGATTCPTPPPPPPPPPPILSQRWLD